MSIAKFLAAALVVFAAAYTYLGWSLAGDSTLSWIALAGPFLCVLSLPLTVWGRDRRRNVKLKDVIAHTAYSAMGVLTYITVFTVLRDILWYGTGDRLPSTWVFTASVAALMLGTVVALSGPKIKHVRVPYPNLPEALKGFKIVQITDLHVGGVITRAYVERTVARANSVNPNIVALTGDIGDGDAARSARSIAPLADLKPSGRVYYVSGNHEFYWNIKQWEAAFEGLGAKVLNNRAEVIEHAGARVLVGGIPDKTGGQLKASAPPDLKAAAGPGVPADFRILLSHRPSPARQAAEVGFDLQISGHTHAGQFFPWTLVVRAVHEFHEGLRRVGRMWIYVSHGTGTWGPPLRLGTTPEVTCIELIPG